MKNKKRNRLIKGFFNVKSIIRHPIKYIKAILSIPAKKSDIKRWGNKMSLHVAWDERTIMIAKLIPDNSSVLEFGAGRLILPKHLKQNCQYQPSDIVNRGGNTIICDLNTDFPELDQVYSHIVFSGVLEYINNLQDLLTHLKRSGENIVASYATIDRIPDYVTRRQSGWVNHYCDESLRELFARNGFEKTYSTTWNNQSIYIFKNTNNI